MTTIFDFSNALNTSITAGWMILAVILLRFLLRNTPKWISVLLWGLVAIRLLLPFSLESVFSLVPSSETIPQELLQYEGTSQQTSAYLDIISNPIYSDGVQIELKQTVDRVQVQMIDMTVFWLFGILVFLLYAVISYLRIYKKVATAILYQDNIFQSEYISSPFVLGIFRPKIYLP